MKNPMRECENIKQHAKNRFAYAFLSTNIMNGYIFFSKYVLLNSLAIPMLGMTLIMCIFAEINYYYCSMYHCKIVNNRVGTLGLHMIGVRNREKCY